MDNFFFRLFEDFIAYSSTRVGISKENYSIAYISWFSHINCTSDFMVMQIQ